MRPVLIIPMLLMLSLCGVAQAQDAAVEITAVESAIDRGLAYLARSQRPEGYWPSWQGNNHGVNALCLLAFLGRGHQLGRGPYQKVMADAVEAVLATQDEAGLFRSPNPSHGPMYEHALATLAMIEAYGSIPTPQFRGRVQRAVDLIVRAQAHTGGWRYQPRPEEADLSVTAVQLIALRAAQNARLNVPRETLDRALSYVRSCFNPAGAFDYQPGLPVHQDIAQATGWKFSPAMAAAGTLSLAMLGAFDEPGFAHGLAFMREMEYRPEMLYFYYTTHYALQAAFQAGGDHWALWAGRVQPLLLQRQDEDGSWPGYAEERFNAGQWRTYSTAFACVSLNVYLHYLPAYQR